MTQKKLAALAKVSVSTVSKAFSYSEEISDDTRTKIFDLAKKNGCYEKFSKNRYHKRAIAVLCPEIQSEYYSNFATKLEARIMKMNAVMLLSVTDFKPSKETEYIEYYTKFKRADALIVVSPVTEVKNSGEVPIVVIGGTEKKSVDAVVTDLSDAVYEAVLLLKQRGRKKIAFFGERLTGGKLREYKAAMTRCGLAVYDKFICTSELRFEGAGYAAFEELFRENNIPDAIIAAYDNIALGAIVSMRNHGLRVPEDISIIGMDNISVDSYLDVPLTSIATHVEELCDAALGILRKKLDSGYYFLRESVIVNAELVRRKSV